MKSSHMIHWEEKESSGQEVIRNPAKSRNFFCVCVLLNAITFVPPEGVNLCLEYTFSYCQVGTYMTECSSEPKRNSCTLEARVIKGLASSHGHTT